MERAGGQGLQPRHLREHGAEGGRLEATHRHPTQGLGRSGHWAKQKLIPTGSGSPRRRREAGRPGERGSTFDGRDRVTPHVNCPGAQSQFL